MSGCFVFENLGVFLSFCFQHYLFLHFWLIKRIIWYITDFLNCVKRYIQGRDSANMDSAVLPAMNSCPDHSGSLVKRTGGQYF